MEGTVTISLNDFLLLKDAEKTKEECKEMLKYAGDKYFDFFKSKGLPIEELTAITKVLANKYNIQL